MASPSLEKSPGAQVRITHRAFDRIIAARLLEHGLKPGYWYYLRELWSREGLTQRELSDAINVKETTTVTMIMGMEADNLIERRRHETDGRKMCIYLTDKSRELEAKLLPVGMAINKIATKGIPRRDVDKCLAVLRQMRENLKAAEG